jgi:hypothetical protein
LPTAFVDVDIDRLARGPLIEVHAWPSDPVELDATVRCYRGGHNRIKDVNISRHVSPLRRRIRLPLDDPDRCSVSGFASYAEEEQDGDYVEGRISLRVYR